MSKLLECLVAQPLVDYLNEKLLIPELKSAYRIRIYTEIAVTKVMADIPQALDNGDVTMLMLLD